MGEKPILFSTPMVQAILDERKRQTRRIMRKQPEHVWGYGNDGMAHVRYPGGSQPDPWVKLRYAEGDRLWVRETFTYPEALWKDEDCPPDRSKVIYKADPMFDGMQPCDFAWSWKPSLFMPKWAARIWLEVTRVRVERIQNISVEDAIAEGFTVSDTDAKFSVPGPQYRFQEIWESINGRESWDRNDWVEVYDFRRAS